MGAISSVTAALSEIAVVASGVLILFCIYIACGHLAMRVIVATDYTPSSNYGRFAVLVVMILFVIPTLGLTWPVRKS